MFIMFYFLRKIKNVYDVIEYLFYEWGIIVDGWNIFKGGRYLKFVFVFSSLLIFLWWVVKVDKEFELLNNFCLIVL